MKWSNRLGKNRHEATLQPAGDLMLVQPPCDVPGQSWPWEPKYTPGEKGKPALSVTQVPDASGDRRQDILGGSDPVPQEPGLSLRWRSREPGSHPKHQDSASTPDELLKQT